MQSEPLSSVMEIIPVSTGRGGFIDSAIRLRRRAPVQEPGVRTVRRLESLRPAHFHADDGWEHCVLTIPLALRRFVTSTADESWNRLCAQIDALIDEELERVAWEGWQPDGPVDFHTLFLRGNVEYRVHAWDLRTLRPRTSVRSYTAVTVPVMRSLGDSLDQLPDAASDT
jgi:hypothetical protein